MVWPEGWGFVSDIWNIRIHLLLISSPNQPTLQPIPLKLECHQMLWGPVYTDQYNGINSSYISVRYETYTIIEIERISYSHTKLVLLLGMLCSRTFSVDLGPPPLLVLLLADPPRKRLWIINVKYFHVVSYICWNDPRDARMDPPIHDPYLLSCGPLAAISLNLMVEGVLMDKSLFNLSLNPLSNVLPPVTTTLP